MVQTASQNRTNSIYSMSKLINGVGQIHLSTFYLYPLISIYWTFIGWAWIYIYIYINALSFSLTLVDDLFRCFRAWPPWPPLKVLAANPKGVWPWRRSAMTSEIGGSLLAALGVVWHWDSLRISMDRMYIYIYICICNYAICPFTAGIYVLDSTIGQTQIIVSILWFYTSSTAQGGGGSFKDRTL